MRHTVKSRYGLLFSVFAVYASAFGHLLSVLLREVIVNVELSGQIFYPCGTLAININQTSLYESKHLC